MFLSPHPPRSWPDPARLVWSLPATEDGVWRGRLRPRQPHLQPLGGLLVVHGLVIGWRPLLGRLEPEEELVGVVWRGLDYQAPPATPLVTTHHREDIQ